MGRTIVRTQGAQVYPPWYMWDNTKSIHCNPETLIAIDPVKGHSG